MVTKGDERAEGQREPRRSVQSQAENDDAQPHDCDRKEVGPQKARLHRRTGPPANPSEDIVKHKKLSLCAEQRRVVRKSGRVLGEHHRRHVCCLVRDPVSIPGAVRRHEQDEYG